MTDAEIATALEQQPRPQYEPSHTHHVSEAIGCSDKDAAVMARAKGLIGEDGWLRCWKCHERCGWHVSLHCAPCRVEVRAREPERQRLLREQERAERERAAEQSRPQQRAAGRSFRDDY